MCQVWPCTTPSVPRPGTARTPSAASGAMPRCAAAATTARARGCSLPLCTPATAASTAASSAPAASSSATSRGWPTVSVPVLSNATVSTRCATSSACTSLIRMPCCAATPVPAMMAAGVASPRAQGQAITSTATAWISAASVPAPAHSQPSSVINASTSTTGTNTADTLSTSRCSGALAACASSTRRMIWASTVSEPTACTCITMRPSPLMEPPVSRPPSSRATGNGSPVSIDSSTCVCPSVTTPSAGMRSPGRTTSRSPTITSATGTSTSPVFDSRCTTSGRRACSARMAAVVCRLARASSHLPSSTSVTTTADASKYRCGTWPG